jgi:hypothetical protein
VRVLAATLALAGGFVFPADRPLVARAPTAQEQQLASIASRLAQRTVAVRCGRTYSHEALGEVWFFGSKPADYTVISTATCDRLTAFAADPARYDPSGCPGPSCSEIEQTALALQVVAHESYHLWGAQEEAKAECYGLQSLWYVASRLGAPLSEAKDLGAFYWRDVYPQHSAQWPNYYTRDCRKRGRLDLRPSDPRWPA